jgi:hypothetical protein
MNLNIVKYLAIIWMYICEFEFKIFKCSCNLYLSNGVVWLKPAGTIDSCLVSTGLS